MRWRFWDGRRVLQLGPVTPDQNATRSKELMAGRPHKMNVELPGIPYEVGRACRNCGYAVIFADEQALLAAPADLIPGYMRLRADGWLHFSPRPQTDSSLVNQDQLVIAKR